MKQFDVVLRSVGDVQDFVTLACAQPFIVTVGNDRHSVNGKSFMQIFSLDLSSPQQVRMDCSDDDYCRFYQATARFRTEY